MFVFKDEFWCILDTKFNTFVNGLVPEALQKNVGILSGGVNPTTPFQTAYGSLSIWTNVSNVPET